MRLAGLCCGKILLKVEGIALGINQDTLRNLKYPISIWDADELRSLIAKVCQPTLEESIALMEKKNITVDVPAMERLQREGEQNGFAGEQRNQNSVG